MSVLLHLDEVVRKGGNGVGLQQKGLGPVAQRQAEIARRRFREPALAPRQVVAAQDTALAAASNQKDHSSTGPFSERPQGIDENHQYGASLE